ncbi:hypothetical protein [Haematobacter sp. UBA3484]|uniref:hypothetical protein n=1 Tax=Haematobacter sp. UBA3484 TaxID=1946582 RepID=UPI0025C44D27|nr:hypothetical protein [Haematobacter sp. UBA3484]
MAQILTKFPIKTPRINELPVAPDPSSLSFVMGGENTLQAPFPAVADLMRATTVVPHANLYPSVAAGAASGDDWFYVGKASDQTVALYRMGPAEITGSGGEAEITVLAIPELPPPLYIGGTEELTITSIPDDQAPILVSIVPSRSYVDAQISALAFGRSYSSKSAFTGAITEPQVQVATVAADGLLLFYRRDSAGATQQIDGSRWRLVASGATYLSVDHLVAGSYQFDVGDRIGADEYRYDVVASDGDVITAGGIHLRVLPRADQFYPVDAFAPPADGADCSAVMQKAINRGRVVLGPRRYHVSNLVPRTSMHIKGEDSSFSGGRAGLICTGGAVFSDAGATEIHGVTLEDFYTDAAVAGCRFWHSPSTAKYTGSFKVRNVVASCNFICLFTCVPIYWLIDRCNFGQSGNRIGGTQEFRIFEAWCTNGNFPINNNVVRDTKHYNCAAGVTFDAAYTVRCGRSWLFVNCTAESFPSACIFDARSVGQVAWLDGWIEWVGHAALFRCAIDNTAPFAISGSPIRIVGPTIYFGDATTQYLVQNINGTVSLRDINMTGVVAQVRAASDPRQMVEPVNIYGAQPAFFNNLQPQGRSFLQRVTPWRNGITQDLVALTSTGSPPTKAAVISDLTGATTTAITAGNEVQAAAVRIPLALMQPLEGGYATFVLVGRFLSSPPANSWARVVRWANTASPTYANISGGAVDLERITGTRLAVSSVSSYIPVGLTSYHIGLQFAPETNGATFQIEGLYVLTGEQQVQYPFVV